MIIDFDNLQLCCSNILLLQCLCYSFVITRFEPIKWIMDPLLDITKNNIILLLINQLLTCIKCCSWWLTLLLTGNLFTASIAFIIAYIYDKKFSDWEKVKFKI